MNKSKHIFVGIAAIIIFIMVLWITGVIPKMIEKQTVISYVKEYYGEIGLKYLPTSVSYDSVKQSNVD